MPVLVCVNRHEIKKKSIFEKNTDDEDDYDKKDLN